MRVILLQLYDAHGNMLEMPHLMAMNWDFADQLKSSEKEGETTHYVYSGGERVRKVVMNTSGEEPYIKYERIYLGAYELYREYTPEEDLYHQRNTHHVLDTQRKIALLEVKTLHEGEEVAEPTAIVRYQYTNHLDSACLELDENAEILSYEEYHPFGTTSYSLHTNDSEVLLKRYKYVHKERDDESGLHYYGARYYAAWLCRFVSVDPLKDDYPFYSTYQYAGNKPVTFIDLDGLEPSDNEVAQVSVPDKPLKPLISPDQDGYATSYEEFDIIPEMHVVQEGDTYSELAQKYGVSVDQLRLWNKHKDTEIPIGANLIVSDPNLKVIIETTQLNETQEGQRNISFFQSTKVFKNDTLIASNIESRNFSIPLPNKQAMNSKEQQEAILWDSIALAASIAAIAGGIALMATGVGAPAGAALTIGAISTISGVIGAGAAGAKLGAHIKNSPESIDRAEKLPTNLSSTLALPYDIAQGDDDLSFSRSAGMVEDLLFLGIRPKTTGVKKVKDLFDYTSKPSRTDLSKLPQGIIFYKNIRD